MHSAATHRKIKGPLTTSDAWPGFGSTRSALALAILSVLLLIAASPAHAQTLTTLFAFPSASASGANPYGGLVLDAEGNLYGTAQDGGRGDCDKYEHGCGVIFELTPAGTESVLYEFFSGVTAFPMSGLIFDSEGNLYGTTHGQGEDQEYAGTVFQLKKKHTEKTLYKFRGSKIKPGDGAFPEAGLVRDSQGNLFGTTYQGGANGLGTLFEITSTGEEAMLYSFGSRANDGTLPFGGLVMDSQGNLYGTTGSGGSADQGTIFKLTPSRTEKVLYRFAGSPDGSGPTAGLVMDAHGNFYGTTIGGGNPNNTNCYYHGCGTVFELSASGIETVLYSFCSNGDCSDGQLPTAGVVLDSQGNLYGTTEGGGVAECSLGCGTIFRLTP
jgi:uncharacterized repeat protein (TIGR03803 family)